MITFYVSMKTVKTVMIACAIALVLLTMIVTHLHYKKKEDELNGRD